MENNEGTGETEGQQIRVTELRLVPVTAKNCLHVYASIHTCRHECPLFSGVLMPISHPYWFR